MEPSRACLPHPSPSTSRRVRTRPAMTKQELRAWCRQRYGSVWWASPAKAQRLEEARKALHCNSTTIARNEHRLVMPPASTAALPQARNRLFQAARRGGGSPPFSRRSPHYHNRLSLPLCRQAVHPRLATARAAAAGSPVSCRMLLLRRLRVPLHRRWRCDDLRARFRRESHKAR